MVSIFPVQYRAVFLFTLALIMPLNVQTFNKADYNELLENPLATYLYCDKDRSPIAEVIAEISKLDADENSPVWQLQRHIEEGSSIGLHDAVVEALEHAERLVSNLVDSQDVDHIQAALNSVIDQVVDGSLLVDLPSALKSGLERACCGTSSKTIKVREKLYVLDSAKFFKDVEFKDNVRFEDDVTFQDDVRFKDDVRIDGSLSVADQVIACDLTVGCNINMVNSTDAAHGNVLKNGIPFVHNFGVNNTFVGSNSGNFTMTGTANTVMGATAFVNNTSGNENSAFGQGALLENITGSGNSAFGHDALSQNTSGSANTAVGDDALLANTTGGQNTAVGAGALEANLTGNVNTAVGFVAMTANISGNANTAVGQSALANKTSGDANTAVGIGALAANIIGGGNIALGAGAGAANVTGDNNIYIGTSGLAAESGVIRIGVLGTSTATFVQGISGVLVAGAVPVVIDVNGQMGTVVSSKRFKHDIVSMDIDSASIYNLEPVSFVYNADASNTKQFGLIAEEVAAVFPEIVVLDEQGEPYTVQYQVLPVLLLNEIKKHHDNISDLLARVSVLEERA